MKTRNTTTPQAAPELHDDPLMDVFIGTGANETYFIDSVDDLIIEAPGGGTDRVLTTLLNYTLPANVENLTFIGSGDFTGDGNDLANVIIGQGGNDILSGGLGRDTLLGQAGDDWLDGGTGVANQMQGGVGDDTYVVRAGGDTIVEFSNEGVDTVRTDLAMFTLRANIENLTYIGSGQFVGVGNALNNVITGGVGRDTLLGRDGDDWLDGGAGAANEMQGGQGDDTYVVRAAGDTIVELSNEGVDTVRTDLASLTLAANLENLTYTGSGEFVGVGNALNNVITGGLDRDTLAGRDGDDTLSGGGGAANTLIGGLGDDTYVVEVAGDATVEYAGEGTDTVQTALGADTLRAHVENLIFTGSGSFVGTGNASANAITGGAGNDTLDGMAGADAMTGLAGDDTYYVDDAGDQAVEAADGGLDTVRATVNALTLFANVETMIFIGTGNFTGTGNGLANRLIGGAGDDSLNGVAGDDVLVGGAGADILDGGAGYDFVDYTGTFADLTIRIPIVGSQIVVQDGTGSGDTLKNIEGAIGGSGNDSLIGGDANDTLIGGLGHDTLSGQAGDDVLIGGSGADSFAGGTGDDTYYLDGRLERIVESTLASGGIDTVYQADVAYTLSAGLENLIYNGGATFTGTGNSGANTITGGAGDDVLLGMAGNDILIGGAGVDQLDGGAGDDIVSYAASVIGVTVDLSTHTQIDGGGVSDVLISIEGAIGSAFADILIAGAAGANFVGGAGDDSLTGGDLNDRLIGGLGADSMAGGLGDDVYEVNDAGDVISENADEGVDTVQTGFAVFALGPNFENLTYTGAAAFTGTGTAGANVILGGSAGDVINGLGGGDTLDGGSGDDTLSGGDGDDVLIGGAGVDALHGGDGIDTLDYSARTAPVRVNLNSGAVLADGQGATDTVTGVENATGGTSADTLIGNGAANRLIGGNGTDTLVGLGGDDFLWGGGHPDNLQGGLGDDTYYAPDGGDTLIEYAGEGSDTIVSAASSYTLPSNFENLSFVTLTGGHSGHGNELNNVITGGLGIDFLGGEGGDDTLIGGQGSDYLSGDAGTDTAVMMGLIGEYTVVRNGDGSVTVTDTAAGVNGDDGVDRLTDMEFVRFSDGTILDLSTLPAPGALPDDKFGTDYGWVLPPAPGPAETSLAAARGALTWPGLATGDAALVLTDPGNLWDTL